jgi:hypothetical protein
MIVELLDLCYNRKFQYQLGIILIARKILVLQDEMSHFSSFLRVLE